MPHNFVFNYVHADIYILSILFEMRIIFSFLQRAARSHVGRPPRTADTSWSEIQISTARGGSVVCLSLTANAKGVRWPLRYSSPCGGDDIRVFSERSHRRRRRHGRKIMYCRRAAGGRRHTPYFSASHAAQQGTNNSSTHFTAARSLCDIS